MATGDKATLAGLSTWAATQDKRLGYDNDNQRGDEIAENRCFVVLRKTASQTLATGGSGAAVSWDSEISDRFGMHDNSTNNTRITIPYTGIWQFAVNLPINSTTGVAAAWAKNSGSADISYTECRQSGAATLQTPLMMQFVADLGATAYVEIFVTESVASGSIIGGAAKFSALLTARYLGKL